MVQINLNPLPAFVTERITLRQMTEADANDILRLRADKSVSKYIARTPYTTIEEAYSFIAKRNEGIANNESGYWGIALNESNKLVGTICVWHIDTENFRAEIGYELHPDYQKKGIMNEAIEPVLKYVFQTMKLHTIEAVVIPGNADSIKLLEKNGFVREAYFKEKEFFNDRFIDIAIYTLLNPL